MAEDLINTIIVYPSLLIDRMGVRRRRKHHAYPVCKQTTFSHRTVVAKQMDSMDYIIFMWNVLSFDVGIYVSYKFFLTDKTELSQTASMNNIMHLSEVYPPPLVILTISFCEGPSSIEVFEFSVIMICIWLAGFSRSRQTYWQCTRFCCLFY